MDGGEAAADCVRDTRAAASHVRRQGVVAGKQPVSMADPGPVQAADVDLEAMKGIPHGTRRFEEASRTDVPASRLQLGDKSTSGNRWGSS